MNLDFTIYPEAVWTWCIWPNLSCTLSSHHFKGPTRWVLRYSLSQCWSMTSEEQKQPFHLFISWPFLGQELTGLCTGNHISHFSYLDHHSQAAEGLSSGEITKHYTREEGLNEENQPQVWRGTFCYENI